jgi:hypothetical protein
MEKGYVLLNWLVSIITDEYVGVAIAVNLFLFIPLYYYLIKLVDKKYWGLCVFIFACNPYMFIQSTFNAMRQGCATGLVLLAVYALLFLRKKRFSIGFYLLLVLLAAQFHRIAYVMVIVPLILEISWAKKDWYIVLIASLVFNIIGTGFLGEWLLTNLEFNVGYLHYESSLLNNPIYLTFIFMFALYLIYHYEDFKRLGILKRKLLDFYMFSICFLVFAVSNDMFYRVYVIMAFCTLPSIPIVCEGLLNTRTHIKIKNESNIVESLYVIYYISFYLGYIMLLVINNNSHYIPFKFFFS